MYINHEQHFISWSCVSEQPSLFQTRPAHGICSLQSAIIGKCDKLLNFLSFHLHHWMYCCFCRVFHPDSELLSKRFSFVQSVWGECFVRWRVLWEFSINLELSRSNSTLYWKRVHLSLEFDSSSRRTQ